MFAKFRKMCYLNTLLQQNQLSSAQVHRKEATPPQKADPYEIGEFDNLDFLNEDFSLPEEVKAPPVVAPKSSGSSKARVVMR